MKRILIALLAQLAIIGWYLPLHAADVPFPVQGEWFFDAVFSPPILQVGDNVVDGAGNIKCAGVKVSHLSPTLAVVECHSAEEGMLQYYFSFDSENRASVWFISSNQRKSLRIGAYGMAQRVQGGYMPAELLGHWYVSQWTPTHQQGVDTKAMEFKQGIVIITDSLRSTECRTIPLTLSSGGEHEDSISLICSAGAGGVRHLRKIFPGEYVVSSVQGEVVLLHRAKQPPSWFAAELMNSCDAVTDQAAREECYSGRSLCEMVAEDKRNPLCIELVKRQKRNLAATEVFRNLYAIASVETAYFGQWGKWVGNQDFTPIANRSGNNAPVKWVNNTRFSILGFAPEGDVQCSYSLEGGEFPAKDEGFSAKAQCDLDANGKVSIWSINRNRRIEHSGDDF